MDEQSEQLGSCPALILTAEPQGPYVQNQPHNYQVRRANKWNKVGEPHYESHYVQEINHFKGILGVELSYRDRSPFSRKQNAPRTDNHPLRAWWACVLRPEKLCERTFSAFSVSNPGF